MAFSLREKIKELWQKFESLFLINFELDFTEASIITRQDIEEDLSLFQSRVSTTGYYKPLID